MNKNKKNLRDLAELLGEEEKTIQDESEPKENLAEQLETLEGKPDTNKVYPVYILHRVVVETISMCKKAIPNEAIGVLLGYKMRHNDTTYVKVVDWVTGNANKSHAYAEFTPEGVRQYTSFIQERYGDNDERPRIVGIIHSHPFGSNPHFSATDYNTFLNFPYDAEHNVFVLVDPKAGYYKSYVVMYDEREGKKLQEVDWVEYTIK